MRNEERKEERRNERTKKETVGNSIRRRGGKKGQKNGSFLNFERFVLRRILFPLKKEKKKVKKRKFLF